MKIVSKSKVSTVFLIALGVLPFVPLAQAYADPVPVALNAPMPSPVPSMAPPPAQNVAAIPPVATLNAPVSAPLPGDTPKAAPAADMNKTITTMEDKVTTSAKDLVKRLDKSSDAMTLEDMNDARQTIARIEALIDIEKHMVELGKLRNERGSGNNEGATALASAIPASALTPFPQMPSHASTYPMSDEQVVHKPVFTPASIEISRIIGTEGKYSAVLKMGNGDLKPVRVGDQVSPNVTVQSIAASDVVLDESGKTHTLHIKNVDVIYSAMR